MRKIRYLKPKIKKYRIKNVFFMSNFNKNYAYDALNISFNSSVLAQSQSNCDLCGCCSWP